MIIIVISCLQVPNPEVSRYSTLPSVHRSRHFSASFCSSVASTTAGSSGARSAHHRTTTMWKSATCRRPPAATPRIGYWWKTGTTSATNTMATATTTATQTVITAVTTTVKTTVTTAARRKVPGVRKSRWCDSGSKIEERKCVSTCVSDRCVMVKSCVNCWNVWKYESIYRSVSYMNDFYI